MFTIDQPDQSTLTYRADKVLDAVTGPIIPTSMQVSIEGHAASLPTNYPSVRELSTERATKVLRYMVERNGLPGDRIGATGYGSARPANTGTTDTDYEQNRRVDAMVLSDEPEAVRALIP